MGGSSRAATNGVATSATTSRPVARRGQLWESQYTDKKTKKREFFSIYGGKLAGILTQSFCRELFFTVLVKLEQLLPANAQLVRAVPR